MYIDREIQNEISEWIQDFPVLAVLGSRQSGKSTIVKNYFKKGESVYLDLESPSDLAKLSEPEMFFEENSDKVICIDEIQHARDLFMVMRSFIDRDRRNGMFIILGSASPELLRQSSESLAGRICYLELSPFSITELLERQEFSLNSFWYRGGYPLSVLARSNEVSDRWRKSYLKEYVERDLPQLGFNLNSKHLEKMFRLLAHQQGQLVNYVEFGQLLECSNQSVRNHIEILEKTFLIRVLNPWSGNVKSRLTKRPKVYIRDSGLLHALLDIEDWNELSGHPIMGASWEGMCVEQMLNRYPKWAPSFYRTSNGSEIDLVLERKGKRVAFEFKASRAPKLTKGFYHCIEQLNPDRVYVVAPVEGQYAISQGVIVSSLVNVLQFGDDLVE